jgi:hypothetical protein
LTSPGIVQERSGSSGIVGEGVRRR